jgi:small conductance mechanosensitive channel
MIVFLVSFEQYGQKFLEYLERYGPRVVIALLVLVVGFRVLRFLKRYFNKFLTKAKVDPTAQPFLVGLFHKGMQLVLLITVATMVGVSTTSLITLLGAAGLAIGLALQGTLSNIAGGLMLLSLKPYRVGDMVEVQNFIGRVDQIQLFHTHLLTMDNRRVILPNGLILGDAIVNITAEPARRVDVLLQVSLRANSAQVLQTLQQVAEVHKARLLPDPEPFVGITQITDRAMMVTLRAWAPTEQYWETYHTLMTASKTALDKAGIEMPQLQLDLVAPSGTPAGPSSK